MESEMRSPSARMPLGERAGGVALGTRPVLDPPLPLLVRLEPVRPAASPRGTPSRGTRRSAPARSATRRRASAARSTPRSRSSKSSSRRASSAHSSTCHVEREQARAHVGRALRVVRERRQQLAREALGALHVRDVELVDRHRPAPRRCRRPRSARRSGCSGRTPCPRRPSPSPGRSSAGSGARTRRARAPRAGGCARARPRAPRARSRSGPRRRRRRPRARRTSGRRGTRRAPARRFSTPAADLRAAAAARARTCPLACSSFASAATSVERAATRRSAPRRGWVSGSSARGFRNRCMTSLRNS